MFDQIPAGIVATSWNKSTKQTAATESAKETTAAGQESRQKPVGGAGVSQSAGNRWEGFFLQFHVEL